MNLTHGGRQRDLLQRRGMEEEKGGYMVDSGRQVDAAQVGRVGEDTRTELGNAVVEYYRADAATVEGIAANGGDTSRDGQRSRDGRSLAESLFHSCPHRRVEGQWTLQGVFVFRQN